MSSCDPELVHKWGHDYSIISIISFPKKNLLFAGTQDSKVLVFTLYTYELIQTIQLGDDDEEVNTRSSVLCLERSVDEKYLFSAGADSLVRIWSLYDIDGAVQIEEVATVYSVIDIGDIFSITYLDSIQTLVFGCQNASMLYLGNIFDQLLEAESPSDINRLPHRRYDKFFDSLGPTGQPCQKQAASDKFHEKALRNRPSNRILEIPSENIINYAHNGFIYSICKLCLSCSNLLRNDNTCEYESNHKHIYESKKTLCPEGSDSSDISECIITGGGDGISKVWCLTKDTNGFISVSSVATVLDNEESVLAQATDFPFLYSGLSEGTIKIWDLTTKQLVSTLHTPDKSDIISISVYKNHIFAINEGGITLFHDKEVIHWNQHQGKMLSSDLFARHVTPYERQLSFLTGGNDGSLRLWNISDVLKNSLSEIESQTLEMVRRKSIALARGSTIKPDGEQMLATLRDLIGMKSVSQAPSTVEQLDSRRCATYLQRLFSKFNANEVHTFPVESGHNPVVFASFEGNGKNRKKLLWYGHYDVIPAADRNRWNSDPFTLTCENGYMRGRGVSDNKGPLVAAIHAVATLLKAGELKNDVIFIVEGSEEVGSPGLDVVCNENRALVGEKIDWIFLSNSTWVDQEHPCLNYGLRGVINAKITVCSDEPDRHSGVDGGLHREPTADLFNIISKLQDDEGKVLIPNFYAPLKEISADDHRRFEKIVEIADFGKDVKVDDLIKNWAKPSLSVTTMTMSGPGNVTVIPQSATAGLSIRLVPEQTVDEVEKALTQYLERCFEELSTPNHLKISIDNCAEPWLGDPSNYAYQIVREEMTEIWEMEPLFVKEGGSVPCVRTLERTFNAPAIQIPCGQSTDNGHLDNENLRIKNWTNLAEVIANVFRRL